MRLIDADKLMTLCVTRNVLTTLKPTTELLKIKAVLEDTPTVDAVEVTRCHDCKYNMGGNCYLLRWYVKDTDFC